MQTFQDGETYFVTLECQQHTPLLSHTRAKEMLLGALLESKKQFGLHLAAYVILDDHIHLVFILPKDVELTGVMNYLRARFLRTWRELTPDSDGAFWEHDAKWRVLKDVDDLRAHLDFVHYDPVHHGAAYRAFDYPWSSLRARVEQGHYTEEWAMMGPPASISRFVVHHA
jgi:putative transposase